MDVDRQVEILMQGTDYGDDELRKAMGAELRERLQHAREEGRPLRVYCGYDPRTTDLHIGHTITMRKLRQFQDLGHQAIFLVGTYTSLIGDPSDQDKLRPRLTPAEVEENARTYAEQAFRILDPEKTEIRYNAEWLSDLDLADMIRLGSLFTIQQFLTRENFRERWENGDAVYLHETFYAIMQGYDAYALRADVQVGGTDQLFNIVTAARKIMTHFGVPPNIAIITGILPGTDGEIRMSKSLGNHIPLNTTPEDMYGKVMSLPDMAMGDYFRLVTHWEPDEIERLESGLREGDLHPRDVKMKLAREVVRLYYGVEEVEQAEASFVRVFQRGRTPQDIPEYMLKGDETVLDVMDAADLIPSRSQGRRLVDQNAVRLDGEVLTDVTGPFPGPGVLQVGKRRFVRVVRGES